jgi:hypothetical protein
MQSLLLRPICHRLRRHTLPLLSFPMRLCPWSLGRARLVAFVRSALTEITSVVPVVPVWSPDHRGSSTALMADLFADCHYDPEQVCCFVRLLIRCSLRVYLRLL